MRTPNTKLLGIVALILISFYQVKSEAACFCPSSYYGDTLICDHTSDRSYFKSNSECAQMATILNTILDKNEPLKNYKCANSTLWLKNNIVKRFYSDRDCWAYLSEASRLLPRNLSGRY